MHQEVLRTLEMFLRHSKEVWKTLDSMKEYKQVEK